MTQTLSPPLPTHTLADLQDDQYLRDMVRSRCQRFQNFVAEAWRHLPGTGKLVWAGYIPVVCDHLEHLWRGTPCNDGIQRDRLLVNIPPECLKSSLLSVLWPAWIWTQNPKAGIVGVSYNEKLNQRDATNSRQLIESDFYRILWPEVVMRSDQNSKSDYGNTLGGWRISTTIGGRATGEHPDVFIWDDPLKAQDAYKQSARQNCLEFYRTTMSTRGAAKGVKHVIGMQRLHPDDPSSLAIDANRKAVSINQPEPWLHVMLPMEYDSSRAMKDYGFGGDWRTTDGELLDPVRLPTHRLKTIYNDLSDLNKAAQYDQNPRVRHGRFFKTELIQSIDPADVPSCDEWVRFFDRAATRDGGCYTAGVLIGRKVISDISSQYFVGNVIRGQWDVDQVEVEMQRTGFADNHRLGMDRYRMAQEEEGGSGGKSSANSMAKTMRGIRFESVRPFGNKQARAEPLARAIARGEVFVIDGNWTADFVDELTDFPNGKFADQVDAASGAFTMLEGTLVKAKPVKAVYMVGWNPDQKFCATDGCKRPVMPGEAYCCPSCEIASSMQCECEGHAMDCIDRYNEWLG